MTVRTNAVQTCDRCLKPFNEKHLKVGDEVPVFKQKGLVVSSTTGTNKEPEPKSTVVLSFDDMCPDCQNAVDNLIAKIRLDGSKPKVAKKRRSKKKKDKPAPPPVKEYSEDKSEAKTEEPAEEPTEKPGPDGEPTTPTEEPQESQEAKAETTEEPPVETPAEENSEPEAEAAPETTEEPPAEAEAEATDDSGNGVEAGSDDDNLMTDPATGDVYDKTTGEVVSKGNSGESEKHPF